MRSTNLWFLIVISSLLGCRVVTGDDAPKPGAGPASAPTKSSAPSEAWLEGDLSAQRPDETKLRPKPGGEVVVLLYSNPPSLNVITDSDLWAKQITMPHVYENLLAYDPATHPSYVIVGGLAERYDESDDHRTFTFHMRKGVTWHDGTPFSARDVKATFDKVMDPTVKAAHLRSNFEELDHYELVDDDTFRMVFKRPYFLTLDTLALSIPIQPAHVIEKLSGAEYNQAATNPLNRAPIGTGPFKLKTWEANSKIVLERNDAYWGKKALLDRVVFRQVLDIDVALQLAERGEIDVVTRVMPEAWDKMASSKALVERFDRALFTVNQYAWIGWNLKREIFKDVRVRRALTMLTDRTAIRERLMHGLVIETDCHFYVEAAGLCRSDKPKIPYDPQGAIALLEAAGFKDSDGDGVRDRGGVELAFTFMIPASSTNAQRIAAKLKEDLGRAGIEMQLQLVEWSAYTKRLREHSFDACTLIWGDEGTRSDPTQIWHSKSFNGGSNYIGFADAKADEIIEQARVTFDDEKREALYRELGDILRDEQPYTWLYAVRSTFLFSKRVRGVTTTLLGYNFEDWWIDER